VQSGRGQVDQPLPRRSPRRSCTSRATARSRATIATCPIPGSNARSGHSTTIPSPSLDQPRTAS
jgi:hypothetical protein